MFEAGCVLWPPSASLLVKMLGKIFNCVARHERWVHQEISSILLNEGRVAGHERRAGFKEQKDELMGAPSFFNTP